jgi:hypothetical protein
MSGRLKGMANLSSVRIAKVPIGTDHVKRKNQPRGKGATGNGGVATSATLQLEVY